MANYTTSCTVCGHIHEHSNENSVDLSTRTCGDCGYCARTARETMADTAYDAAIAYATTLGTEHGTNAAGWYDGTVETPPQSTGAFVAGWNMAGYLPETDPVAFETIAEAVAYLRETVERWLDEEPEADDYAGETGESIISTDDDGSNDPLHEAWGEYHDLHLWAMWSADATVDQD